MATLPDESLRMSRWIPYPNMSHLVFSNHASKPYRTGGGGGAGLIRSCIVPHIVLVFICTSCTALPAVVLDGNLDDLRKRTEIRERRGGLRQLFENYSPRVRDSVLLPEDPMEAKKSVVPAIVELANGKLRHASILLSTSCNCALKKKDFVKEEPTMCDAAQRTPRKERKKKTPKANEQRKSEEQKEAKKKETEIKGKKNKT
ncbi:hypothetical protein Bbelb_022920 [Branchiostoma belcheri]|nr:hypothetical protein Bbelb_022920 [Branchiostoma belcheri]